MFSRGRRLYLYGLYDSTNQKDTCIHLSHINPSIQAPLVSTRTVVAGVLVGQRVAQVGHLLLGLQRGLPLGLGQLHRQLVDAAGVEDLGGGIGRGLGRLAGAVVVGLGGEVDAAVDGAVREHGTRFVALAVGKV